MEEKTKPKRRSMLFCPAIDKRFYRSALQSSADSIIYDLEDSITNSAKQEARSLLLKNYPRSYAGPKELVIRINNSHTPFYKRDLELLRTLKPDTVCYPKVESALELVALDSYISSYDKGKTEIFPLIETSAGFFNSREILKSSNRITATALGLEDLIYELGIERGKLSENPIINHVLINLILLSSSLGIQHVGPILRGYGTKKQMKELTSECTYLKKMNVVGKLAIHPNQLNIINKEFDITSEKIGEAKEKLALFEKSRKKGSSVISRCYEMEDTPSEKRLVEFLKYAKQHGFGIPIR